MALTTTTQETAAMPTYTTIATGNKLADIKLSKVIWVEHQKESFFEGHGFIGKEGNMNSIVWLKTELNKGGGETIRIFLNKRLTGSGITADSILLGNEEQLNYDYMEITLDQLRHAVAIGGALAEQRSVASMRIDSKNRLKTWMAEKLDASIFTQLSSGTPTYAVYPGAASSVGTLSSVDLLDLPVIAKARSIMKLARIKGIKIKGQEHYVMLIHPEQAYDLQANVGTDLWQTIQMNAAQRGDSNPLFSGALGAYLGVILFDHENVTQADTGGSGSDLHYSMSLMLGAGACVRAYGGFKDGNKQIKAVEERFDYGNVFATALAVIYKDGKTRFTADGGSTYTDYAVCAVYTVCTDL